MSQAKPKKGPRRRRREPVAKCPWYPTKAIYTSRTLAEKVRLKRLIDVDLRVYACNGHFHLTSRMLDK